MSSGIPQAPPLRLHRRACELSSIQGPRGPGRWGNQAAASCVQPGLVLGSAQEAFGLLALCSEAEGSRLGLPGAPAGVGIEGFGWAFRNWPPGLIPTQAKEEASSAAVRGSSPPFPPRPSARSFRSWDHSSISLLVALGATEWEAKRKEEKQNGTAPQLTGGGPGLAGRLLLRNSLMVSRRGSRAPRHFPGWRTSPCFPVII